MKFSRGSILVSLLLAASLSQALPPAPQGPYHSLEDERVGILPQQAMSVQNSPYAALSSWSWGAPAYSVDNLPGKAVLGSASDLPGKQEQTRQQPLSSDGGLR